MSVVGSAASTTSQTYPTGAAATTKAQSSIEGRRLMRESKAALVEKATALKLNLGDATKGELTCAILERQDEKEFFDGFSQASSDVICWE